MNQKKLCSSAGQRWLSAVDDFESSTIRIPTGKQCLVPIL